MTETQDTVLTACARTAPSNGGMAAAVAAVLLYRLITYWAVLPAGGLCYLSLRRRHSLVIPAPAAAASRQPVT